jgi:hypothetical protein
MLREPGVEKRLFSERANECRPSKSREQAVVVHSREGRCLTSVTHAGCDLARNVDEHLDLQAGRLLPSPADWRGRMKCLRNAVRVTRIDPRPIRTPTSMRELDRTDCGQAGVRRCGIDWRRRRRAFWPRPPRLSHWVKRANVNMAGRCTALAAGIAVS